MHVDTALTLVNESLVYPPGYKVTATDHSKRFEDTVCLHVNIDAQASDRAEAPDYATKIKGGARSSFAIAVGDVKDVEQLTYRVINALIEATTHELREFVRVTPTFWAPFHPHRIDGIKRWSQAEGVDPKRDYLFGLS